MARRAGCIERCPSSSRKADGLKIWIINPDQYPSSIPSDFKRSRGERDTPWAATPKVGQTAKRVRKVPNPPTGSRPKPSGHPGARPVLQVGTTCAGVGSLPVATRSSRTKFQSGAPPRTTRRSREQLNDERGVKPLPVRLRRDGAEQGNVPSEG